MSVLACLLPACSVLQPPGERAAPPDLTFEQFRVEQYREGTLTGRATFAELEYRREQGLVNGHDGAIRPTEGNLAGATITSREVAGSTKQGLATLTGGVVYRSSTGDQAETEACTVDLIRHTMAGDQPVAIRGAEYHSDARGFDGQFGAITALNLLGGTHSVLAETAAPTQKPPQSLEITSDTLTIRPGTRTALAHGHVLARGATFEATGDDGEATYSAPVAGQKRTVETLRLQGHFHMRRFSDNLIADSNEATYDAKTALVTLTGEPVVTRGSDVLHGDVIEVGTDDETVVVQQPRVDLPRKKSAPVHVRSEQLTVLDHGAHMRFERNVQVREGAFTSRSDRMDAYTEPGEDGASQLDRLVMIGHVEAHRGNQSATAGHAVYDVASTDLLLEDAPVVIQDGNELRGETITINNTTGRATAKRADVNLHETAKEKP